MVDGKREFFSLMSSSLEKRAQCETYSFQRIANVFAKHNRYVNNTGLIGFPKLVNYSSRFNPLGGILK